MDMDNQNALYLFLISLHLFIAFGVNKVRQDTVTKNWARLFSIALIIMAAQYALQWYSKVRGIDLYGPLPTLLSVSNNLFFLAGALTLLDRTNQSNRWKFLFSNPLFLIILAATICIVIGVFLSGKDLPFAIAMSSAAVSVIVYIVEAFAYFTVLNFFRYNILRALPVITALIFSVLEVVIAIDDSPRIAYYVTIPLRWLFFISPLMILTLHMPQDFEVREVFENAIPKREFILSKRAGLVKSIGQLIKAQKVLLLIKRPDFHLSDSNLISKKFDCYGWQDKQTENAGLNGQETSLEDMTEEERDFLEQVCPQDRDEAEQQNPNQYCYSKDNFETIILPIVIYGGIIGTLFVRLHRGIQTRVIFIEKLKLAVLNLLPLVQSSRQMAAIGMLSERFTKNLILDGRTDNRENAGTKLKVTEGVNEILGSILDILSPLAIALKPSEHFNSSERVLLHPDNKYFSTTQRGAFIQKYFAAEADDNPLDGIKPFRREMEFGRMIMFVGEENDYPNRPTMGTHPNVLDVLEAMTNNALKTVLRRNLKRILDDADKEISEEITKASDENRVVQMLQKYAKSFGISWIVMVVDGNRFLGDKEKIELVQRQINVLAYDREIRVEKLVTESDQICWLITSNGSLKSSTKNNGRPESHISFWFAIENPEFNFDEPWRNIFFQFTQLGMAKIKDLRMREMATRIDNDKATMTLVRMHGVLAHKFGTHLNELKLATARLEDDVESLEIELPEKIIGRIDWWKKSLDALSNLTNDVSRGARTIKADSRQLQSNERPCDLRDVTESATDSVALRSKFCGINIFRSGNGAQVDLRIDVPQYVAFHSLHDVLSNSINALEKFGSQSGEKKIEIMTTATRENVYCQIKDNGMGFPEGVKPFDIETGWGLNLIKAMLEDYNCSIEIKEKGRTGTIIELRFPKHRQNEKHVWTRREQQIS
jgi:signal transduction histidine kinase